jgi:hypothetical protein
MEPGYASHFSHILRRDHPKAEPNLVEIFQPVFQNICGFFDNIPALT